MPVKRKAALGFIFVTILLDIIGLGIIIPVIPTLIVNLADVGLSEASRLGGWLMFSYAIMQFVFAPILGALSDRFGRRPVLLLSLFGLGLDYLFHAWAPGIAWLFIGRIIAGVSGASITTGYAYIADISEPEKRSQNFGLIGAAFGLGFIIGPVIGGVFSQFGMRVPFLVAAGLSFLNVLYGFFVLPESLPKENRRSFNWKRANPFGSLLHLRRYPVVSGLFVSIFLLHLASHAVQSTWSFFTMYKFTWDEAMVGYSLGFVGLIVAIVQGGLIRVIIPKIGQTNSIFYGLILYFVGLVLFSFASQGWMMFVIILPYALGGISGPALQGILSIQVSGSEQGELQGALTSLMSITSILGPPLMTGLFSHFTGSSPPVSFPGIPFMMGAILILFSLILSIKPLKKFRLAHLGNPDVK